MATTPKSNKDSETKQPVGTTPATPATARPGGPAPDDRQAPGTQGGQPSSQQSRPANRPADGARTPSNSPQGQGQNRRPESSSGGQRNNTAPQGQNRGPDANRPATSAPGRDANGQGPARRPEPGRPAAQGNNAPARRSDQARPDNGQRPGQPGSAPNGQRPGQSGPGSNSQSRSTGPGQSGSGSNSQSRSSGPGQSSGRPGGSSSARPGGSGAQYRGGPYHGGRPGGGRPGGNRKHPGGKGHAAAAAVVAEQAEPARTAARSEAGAKVITEVVIPTQITVRELAEKMHKSPIEVIKALMNYGIMVPITQTIDFDTAVVVGEDLGITVKGEALPEPEVKDEPVEAPRTLRQQIMAEENPEALVVRPPVVTILGHVDHGKTTLLDAIRETRVVEGEAGGITQHIGAYQVDREGRKITFLDTPGHAAFTAMRARGASVTDVAVVVVAADDGVMPQTKEAIAHVRAAQVPILIALNKIDKANANPDRVKQELADNQVLVEEYGGDVVCVPVSAKMRRGIDDLLESILLVYDVDPAKANPTGECVGSVVESRLDKTRGPMATLLVQNGTLRVGDSVVLGETYGKIRAMFDDKGQVITEAPPSTPAVVLGVADVPTAGDTFKVVTDERTARLIASERSDVKRAESNQPAIKTMTLENIFAQVEAGQAKDLNLILKADVQGSIEPIVNSLDKLSNDKVRVKVLHEGTGNITESDVMLAIASKAIILGFSVSVDGTAQRMAEAEGVDIRNYNIIYNLVEDVEKALKGMLEPVYKEVVTGHAEIRQVFRVTKVGKIAGCYVTDGQIDRNTMVRLRRAGEVIADDKVVTLKRFTEDVAEVKTGYECGINLGNFNDFEVGDQLEAYKKERVS